MSGADAQTPLMLKRLRVKLVALSMTVVTLALVAALVAIGYLDYRQSVDAVYRELDQTLSLAASLDAGHRGGERPFGESTLIPEKRGPFGAKAPDAANSYAGAPAVEAPAAEASATGAPAADGLDPAAVASAEEPAAEAPDPSADATAADEGLDPSAADDGQDDAAQPAPPEIGRGDGQGSATPVAVYRVDDQGDATTLGRLTTASVASDLLPRALEAALESEDGQGYLSDQGLFFAQRRLGDVTLVAFADQAAASSWQSLALTLAAVGAGALLAFLAVSILFARWALRPVEQAWDQQQRFVADASHELKTPLTVILANLAIVRSRGDEPVSSQDQWLAGTEVEARRMQALVGDLLDLARTPDPATLRANFGLVDLTDLVEGEALQFDSVALDRGVSITCDLEPSLRVEGDAARLERLIAVLIDNACKYAEPSTEVAVRLAAEGREVVLSVANHGPLIAPADLSRVFDRFFRADAARTRADGQAAVGGYGLGLSIAREIARDHGGSLSATSVPEAPGLAGAGPALTTFTAQLPRA